MRSQLTLLVAKKEGLFKQTPAILSFFEEEVLITTIDKEKQKDLQEKAKKEAKDEGKGKIKTMFAVAKALQNYADELSYMKKDEILKNETITIKKSDIKKIKFSKAARRDDPEMNQTTNIGGTILIKLENEKIKFTHTYEDNHNEIKKYIKDWE
jgi:hypothetical protein